MIITGVLEIDLNSPEPDPDLYGPWPVNRVVRGLEGNGQFLLPYIRDGLLIHTGNTPSLSRFNKMLACLFWRTL